jgi:hypothetical protein
VLKPRITLDPEVSLGSVEKLREPLEDQLSSALQAAVVKVDRRYHGEGVDEVAQELADGTRAGLHPDIADAIEPDPAQLHEVAIRLVDEAS